jgi:hypothetical protein
MLPLQPYAPGKYPPGPRWAQFGDDLLEAHSKLVGKRQGMMNFHTERLDRHGLRPLRDAAVQAVPQTGEMRTGPDQESAAEPRQHGPEQGRGHGFIDAVVAGGRRGARHGWNLGEMVGAPIGYVATAMASLATAGVVGAGKGAVNHMINSGSPYDLDDEGAPVSSAAASAPPVPRHATPAEPRPVYLLDRPDEPLPQSLQNRPAEARVSMLDRERRRYRERGESTGEDPFYPWREYKKH